MMDGKDSSKRLMVESTPSRGSVSEAGCFERHVEVEETKKQCCVLENKNSFIWLYQL